MASEAVLAPFCLATRLGRLWPIWGGSASMEGRQETYGEEIQLKPSSKPTNSALIFPISIESQKEESYAIWATQRLRGQPTYKLWPLIAQPHGAIGT
jgi:hypothetical protein